MPEFAVDGTPMPSIDPEMCLILEGAAHAFGHSELADQLMAQATIPDQVWLIQQWDTEPIGRAEVTRTDNEIIVRAWVPVEHAAKLVDHPHLALAVKIVGKQGDASTIDYVSVTTPWCGGAPYRLTQVPQVPAAEPALRDYVHVEHGTEERRREWWHRDDPVLAAIFPPERLG